MSKKILLADDSVTIQKVVELAFLEEDFEVVTRPSGSQALAEVEREPPAVLVCDIHMPGIDGYEVCERARRLDPELPVLLLVGTFETFDEDRYRSSGAQAYLRKPFDSQELVRRVRDLAARRARGGEEEETGERTEVLLQPAMRLPDEAPAAPAPPTPPTPTPSASEPVFETAGAPALGPSPEGESKAPPVEPEAATLEGPPIAEAVDAAIEASAESDESDESDEREDSSRPAPFAEVPTLDDLRLTGPTEVISDFRPPQPPPTPPQAPQPEPPAASVEPGAAAGSRAHTSEADGALSDADVERIARRVAEILGDAVVREVVWEVVPDLAEVVVRERLEELERQVEEL